MSRSVFISTALVGALSLAIQPHAGAQEVSITPVYTADAYAQPLQLDVDRYAREREDGEGSRKSASTRTRAGTDVRGADRAEISQSQLQDVMRQLTPEYNRRLRRDGEAAANSWIRQAAFEMGRQAAQSGSATR